MELTQTKAKSHRGSLTFIMVYIGYLICFIDRSAISIALSYIGRDLHLSTSTLGVVASAFFFSYALMQIPGGWLTDKFGTYRTIIAAIAMWSVFTILTGFAWSLVSLIVIRILFGIGEGTYPSASLKQISEAMPYKKRASATSATISSNYVGAAIAPVIIAPIIATAGWRTAFHLMGLIGVVFIVVYAIILRPKKQAVRAASKASGQPIKTRIPWKQVLSNGVLWQFFLIVFGLSSVTKGLDSWMPTYLLATRHINLAGISWLVPLPSLAAGAGSLIAGYVMVRFFKGKEKLFIGVTSLLATLLMFGMYKSVALPAVITFEIFTYFCKSLAFAGTFALFAELVSKKAYGSSVGIVNFGGQLSGFLAPIVIGVLVQISNGSYTVAFLFLVFTAAIAFVAALTLSPTKLSKMRTLALNAKED
ncbi:MFS transporter [Lacticaseibacillus chiayiensis]|uniref:MFS transporter n=1 Tax=Lacticaseibacillus chiayiensis TaxID=2100821 RepID=UPI003C7684F1